VVFKIRKNFQIFHWFECNLYLYLRTAYICNKFSANWMWALA